MFLDHLISYENLDKWLQKYDLEVKKGNCSLCKEELITTVPIFSKDFRGLKAPNCSSCGNKKVPFTIIFIK